MPGQYDGPPFVGVSHLSWGLVVFCPRPKRATLRPCKIING